MKIALAQTEIVWEDKETNERDAERYTAQAAAAGAQAVFFPEMSLTGFSMNTEKTAESDGETIERFARIAAGNGIAVGIGWTGQKEGAASNHYSVLDNRGKTVSDYIKIHPFSYGGEDRFFIPGKEIVYFRLGGYTWSSFICYDMRFPELFQAACAKAEVVVVAADWPGKREEHWKSLLRARAIENQCYILGVNCTGHGGGNVYRGGSCCISPEGEILGRLDERPGLLTAELTQDVKELRERFPVKKDRRWDLYISEYRRHI